MFHQARFTPLKQSRGAPSLIRPGLAYFFLVTFAVRNFEIGIGVGGAFTVIGAAFFANAMMLQKAARTPVRRAEPRIPPTSTREG